MLATQFHSLSNTQNLDHRMEHLKHWTNDLGYIACRVKLHVLQPLLFTTTKFESSLVVGLLQFGSQDMVYTSSYSRWFIFQFPHLSFWGCSSIKPFGLNLCAELQTPEFQKAVQQSPVWKSFELTVVNRNLKVNSGSNFHNLYATPISSILDYLQQY